jgi:hypothetical protein
MYFKSIREKNVREIREGCEILKIKKVDVINSSPNVHSVR